MPVASTVIPSPLSFRDGNSRPATGVRRVTRAVREGQEPRAGTACRTRAGIARATWRGCRHAARAAPGAGALVGRDRTTWARGHRAGTVGPGESVTGGHVRRQSDGGRTGWRERPRRGARPQRPPGRCGKAAVVTGPYGASLRPLATPNVINLRGRHSRGWAPGGPSGAPPGPSRPLEDLALLCAVPQALRTARRLALVAGGAGDVRPAWHRSEDAPMGVAVAIGPLASEALARIGPIPPDRDEVAPQLRHDGRHHLAAPGVVGEHQPHRLVSRYADARALVYRRLVPVAPLQHGRPRLGLGLAVHVEGDVRQAGGGAGAPLHRHRLRAGHVPRLQAVLGHLEAGLDAPAQVAGLLGVVAGERVGRHVGGRPLRLVAADERAAHRERAVAHELPIALGVRPPRRARAHARERRPGAPGCLRPPRPPRTRRSRTSSGCGRQAAPLRRLVDRSGITWCVSMSRRILPAVAARSDPPTSTCEARDSRRPPRGTARCAPPARPVTSRGCGAASAWPSCRRSPLSRRAGCRASARTPSRTCRDAPRARPWSPSTCARSGRRARASWRAPRGAWRRGPPAARRTRGSCGARARCPPPCRPAGLCRRRATRCRAGDRVGNVGVRGGSAPW